MKIVLATAAFPTLAVLFGIRVNNLQWDRLEDAFDRGFTATNRHLDDVKQILQADLLRMEQVIDARLKHLEERLQR